LQLDGLGSGHSSLNLGRSQNHQQYPDHCHSPPPGVSLGRCHSWKWLHQSWADS
jgi:hypothetical protein